jgi:hypothetical protein
MANKKTRIWLILLSIPVIVIVGVVVFLKVYFSGDRLKNFVIPEVETALHKKVEIKDISLSLFPPFRVELEGLKISSPKGHEFEKQDFVSLDELILDVNIFALFKNSLDVNEVIVRRPHLYLEVNKDGVANYIVPGDTVMVDTSKRIKAKGEISQQASILLSNFQIIDGDFEYINKKDDRHIAVTNINQKTHVETSSATEDILIKSEWRVGGISLGSTKSYLIENLPLNVDQTLTYVKKNDELVFDSVVIGMNDITLIMTGKVTESQTKPYLNLEMKTKSAELSHLLSLVPKEFLKSAQGLSTTGKFSFSMIVKGEISDSLQPAINGKFSLVGGTVKYSQLPRAITDISVSGEFEKNQNIGKFSINKLNLNIGNNPIEGNLSVSDFENPNLSAYFKGTLNLAEIGEFYPLEKGTSLGGVIGSNISLSGKAKIPTSIKADGKIEFQNVSIATSNSPKPVKNLNGVINFNNQLIESKQLEMNIGESDLKLAFTVKNYLAMVMEKAAEKGKPSASITLTSNRLRTADIVSEPAKTDQPAAAKLQSAALPLPNMDVDANVDIKKFSTDKFDFENARGTVRFSEGIVNLKNFSVNAFQGNVITEGMLDLREPKERPFNLKLDVVGVEANSFLSKFTSFGNNIFGKFTMNTTMKGSLDDTLGLISKSLLGDGKVQVSDGRLTGYPIMAKISEFTGLNEFHQIDFKNWSNMFSVANGKINIKDLKINSLNTDFTVNGSQGFEGTLDYTMAVKLPGSVSDRLKVGGMGGQALNLLKDKDGRIILNLLVGGILNNPSVGLNTKEQQKQLEGVVKQELDKKKGQLENQAREEAKKLLQDSSKQKGIEDLKKKVGEQLKNFFKKK